MPAGVAELFEEECLDAAAGGHAVAPETRGNHAGVIEDEAVAGLQVGREVGEMPCLMGTAAPVNNEHARVFPPLCGMLGDKLGW